MLGGLSISLVVCVGHSPGVGFISLLHISMTLLGDQRN